MHHGARDHDTPASDPAAGRHEPAVRQARIRDALAQLYGAAAALVRHDREGAEILVHDLRSAYGDTADLLVAVSLVTLERLEAAFRDPSLRPHGRPLAADLIGQAVAYRAAPAEAVHAAAWRLDGVRQHDRHRASSEIDQSRPAGNDAELLAGAVSLLAATIATGARLAGADAVEQARALCFAAAMEPHR